MRPLPPGWVLKWDAAPGIRMHKQFNQICTWNASYRRIDGSMYFQPTLWWDHGRRQWINHMPVRHAGLSSSVTCKSLRSFIRHLHRHDKTLRGYEVILSNRYCGYDVTATYVGV